MELNFTTHVYFWIGLALGTVAVLFPLALLWIGREKTPPPPQITRRFDVRPWGGGGRIE